MLALPNALPLSLRADGGREDRKSPMCSFSIFSSGCKQPNFSTFSGAKLQNSSLLRKYCPVNIFSPGQPDAFYRVRCIAVTSRSVVPAFRRHDGQCRLEWRVHSVER